ncbi:MAG: HIT domain-containing protein [Thermoleophilia bacterium]
MKQLWAPWRMRYIKSEKPGGCIFCDKPAAGDDQANHIVWRGEKAFVLLNAYPYNNGHLMVAPYAHIGELESLPADTLAEIMNLCQDAVRALKRDFNAEGINVGLNLGAAAGAGVKDHLHFHLVPRWVGDTNFMPVTADVRIIPQSLDHAWSLLHKAFADLRTGQGADAPG